MNSSLSGSLESDLFLYVLAEFREPFASDSFFSIFFIYFSMRWIKGVTFLFGVVNKDMELLVNFIIFSKL